MVRTAAVPVDGLRLSVVVPCYNVGALAAEAVCSLLHQTMPALEVIAVDDGSTDDTLAQLLALGDPRLTVVTQANRGLAAARNTGVAHARAPLIGFCDGDDVWFPDKAAKQLAVMDADATVGLTFSHSAYLDESGAPTGQMLVSRCRQPTTRDLVARNHIGNGSTAIVRRECFAAAGLFDESLASCEDAEPHLPRALPQLRPRLRRSRRGPHLRAPPARAEPQGLLQRRHRAVARHPRRGPAALARHRRARRAYTGDDRPARARLRAAAAGADAALSGRPGGAARCLRASGRHAARSDETGVRGGAR